MIKSLISECELTFADTRKVYEQKKGNITVNGHFTSRNLYSFLIFLRTYIHHFNYNVQQPSHILVDFGSDCTLETLAAAAATAFQKQ